MSLPRVCVLEGATITRRTCKRKRPARAGLDCSRAVLARRGLVGWRRRRRWVVGCSRPRLWLRLRVVSLGRNAMPLGIHALLVSDVVASLQSVTGVIPVVGAHDAAA